MKTRLLTVLATVLFALGLGAATALAYTKGPITLTHEGATYKGEKGEGCGEITGCYPTMGGDLTITGAGSSVCYEIWMTVSTGEKPWVNTLGGGKRQIHCGNKTVRVGGAITWSPFPGNYFLCRVTQAGDKVSCGAKQAA
ncbi:hypothetical protein JOF53_001857 [Crossiella equi]|uniref:Secreted protein n=1 Tax=Crossiella equi TaxID=130796 RepID=A0ABS5A8T2_9PSEU|nr:hypothetical protein [Crossiella equi]MBP2472985.1 hypothetical protein [Crossiella equi]